jgi:hypothetical protein
MAAADKKERPVTSSGKKTQKNVPLPEENERRFEFNLQFQPRQALAWGIVVLLFVPFLVNIFLGSRSNQVSLTTLLRDAKAEKIQKVTIEGETMRLTYKDGTSRQSRKEGNQDFVTLLRQVNIDPTVVDVEVKGISISPHDVIKGILLGKSSHTRIPPA